MAYVDQFLAGMEVRDVNDDPIGKLVRYDSAIGYFETDGSLLGGVRYIPYYAVEGAGPSGIRLNVDKHFVREAYEHMPKIRPELDERGRFTGRATVESGHGGGKRLPLDAEATAALRDQIHVGSAVFDDAEKKLGEVDGYDPDSGYMRLKEGVLAPKEVFLPATTVAFVDERGVHLSLTKQGIADRFTRVPQIARAFFAR
jgi:hypothetical protein